MDPPKGDPKGKADKDKADKPKGKAEKDKADKPKGKEVEKSKDVKPKPKIGNRGKRTEPVNKKFYYKENPIVKKKGIKRIEWARANRKKVKKIKIGKVRYGRKKREIIRKILRPHIKKVS